MDKEKNNNMRLKRRLGYILVPLIYGLIISSIVFACYITATKLTDKVIRSYSDAAKQSTTVSETVETEGTTWQ